MCTSEAFDLCRTETPVPVPDKRSDTRVRDCRITHLGKSFPQSHDLIRTPASVMPSVIVICSFVRSSSIVISLVCAVRSRSGGFPCPRRVRAAAVAAGMGSWSHMRTVPVCKDDKVARPGHDRRRGRSREGLGLIPGLRRGPFRSRPFPAASMSTSEKSVLTTSPLRGIGAHADNESYAPAPGPSSGAAAGEIAEVQIKLRSRGKS